MKESIYKTYDELPLFLNAATAAKLLGISISSMYELMHEKGLLFHFICVEIRFLSSGRLPVRPA